jgi:hypothetical protein
MTFIEQACHRRATELWRSRPNLDDWYADLISRFLKYYDVSSSHPTSSASIVVFRGIAAAGAEAYRRQFPVITQWRNSLASEPQLPIRKLSEFLTKAADEIRLHQDILANLFRLGPERAR